MFNWKKLFAFIFCIAFSAQILSAQSAWNLNNIKDSGDLVAVFFTSSERGFVAGDNGYLALTDDGGRNWSRQALNTKEDISEIYFRNDDNGYLVAGKDMFLTKNGGRSWQKTLIFNPDGFKGNIPEFLSIRFADKKLGVAIGSLLNKGGKDARVVDSIVMRTKDGGETWSRVAVPSKKELFHLDFVNDSRGWIVGDDGLILTTFDGGTNWQTQKSGTTKGLYNVDFRDSNNGFAVGENGLILRTENGGETWETVKTSFPKTFLRVHFADDKNGWIVGFGGTILRTADKGKTWLMQESKMKDNLYGLFMAKKYGWAVGANGSIIEYQK
jgi:photosystem II stability/assembly factor-like uncharacterized protein